MSRRKRSAKTFSLPGWRTESLTALLSGTTSAPLTPLDGGVALTLFMEAIPVNLLVLRESAMENLIRATYGPLFDESLESCAQRIASSRTLPGTSLSDLMLSPEAWKRWVTGLRQDSLRRRKSALRIGDNACSFLPSPRANKWGPPDSHGKIPLCWQQTPRTGSHGVPGVSSRHGGQPKGVRINPSHWEWIMGFPIGWTDLSPLATLSYQTWCRSRGFI